MFGQITKEQWDLHPSFRKDLQELINHPAFVAAYGIVLAQGLKAKVLPAVPDPTIWAAIMGQRKEAYLEALDNFIALTEIPRGKPSPVPPWTKNITTQKPETES